MVDLPKKKVGIVACSGEELSEGTVTRLAALQVLEKLRPNDTMTNCMPLFLAGGEGDRAFARFYPTIAVDGCELRCAARATELYSGKPAASVVVREVMQAAGISGVEGMRRLNQAGKQAVTTTAAQLAETVDELLGKRWNRRSGEFIEIPLETIPLAEPQEEVQATCSCGSGVPIQKLIVSGQEVTFIALPLIFKQFQEAGKTPAESMLSELFDVVKIYNPVPPGEEEAYAMAIFHAYQAYWEKELVR
jgi:uncharacterized metal-binding protein